MYSELAGTGSENGFVREDLLLLVFQVSVREYDGDIGEVWGVVEAACVSEGVLLGALNPWILTIGTTLGMSWHPWLFRVVRKCGKEGFKLGVSQQSGLTKIYVELIK